MSHSLMMNFEQFEKVKAENEVLKSKLDDALILAAQLLDVITNTDAAYPDDLEDWGQELRHIRTRKGNG